MQRVSRIVGHIIAASDGVIASPLHTHPTASLSGADKSDDDIVIVCAYRTAICRAKGAFKNSAPEDLLGALFKEVVSRTKVDPKVIGDCQIGNALQPGAGANGARIAQFLGGLPIDVPVMSVNRQCSSGLQAVANVAAAIKAGQIDVGLAGGVESMSMYSMMDSIDPSKLSGNILDNDLAKSCLIPMGMTSENVAEKWGISRSRQDVFAAESHKKASKAQLDGLFTSEIIPVGDVQRDDGIRKTSAADLGKLKPVFKAGGSTTAGNASQVSDGAALVLLARRSAAKAMSLPIKARIRSFAVVGVDPVYMGIGPAFAIPAALEKANLKVDDIDIFEINEAFASQAIMSVEHLKIPEKKVNPKGGAIALGHPLGCTGARQIATLIPELERTHTKLGVVSMCIGTGMGAAAVIERD